MARFLSFILLAIVICSGCIANQEGAATPSPSFEASQLPQATNEAEKGRRFKRAFLLGDLLDTFKLVLAQLRI